MLCYDEFIIIVSLYVLFHQKYLYFNRAFLFIYLDLLLEPLCTQNITWNVCSISCSEILSIACPDFMHIKFGRFFDLFEQCLLERSGGF